MQIEPTGIYDKYWKTDSWEAFLGNFGIAESDYLAFGEVWRELGRKDELASARQHDQFIYLGDLDRVSV